MIGYWQNKLNRLLVPASDDVLNQHRYLRKSIPKDQIIHFLRNCTPQKLLKNY